jgi:hypothetical protein
VLIGRVYELQNKKTEALEAYEEAQTIEERDDITRLMDNLSLSEADKISKSKGIDKALV